MSALELRLAFQDTGQKGDALAVGHISGRVSGSDLQVTLNVQPTGEIHTFQKPKTGHISSQFTSPSKLSVLTADRSQYEALIGPRHNQTEILPAIGRTLRTAMPRSGYSRPN